MRAASRLLAAVKPARYLEPNTPTGLTGLLTHPFPRSTLIYLYNSTLEKLKKLPETSVYRQSTEALTRHRLALVEGTVPEGLESWSERVRKQVEANPGAFEKHGVGVKSTHNGSLFVTMPYRSKDDDDSDLEWDGEKIKPEPEGPRSESERRRQWEGFDGDQLDNQERYKIFQLEPEPPLTAEQISELEGKIGGGLIEEVIQVAEGEHSLVDQMVEARVWEDLEDKPAEGQWTYHERAAHTATQKP